MAYKMKFSLSTKDLQVLKNKIDSITEEVEKSNTAINDSVGKFYSKELKKWHDNVVGGFPIDTFDHNANVDMQSLQTKTIVRIYGPNVIYDEFGVGDIGASYEHPYHAKFDMNDYSSGPYISTHEDGEGHYWDTPYGQRYGWTSGRFVFDSVQYMNNGKARSIARKTIKNIVKKVTE